MQSHWMSWAEAATNTLLGIVVSQLVLAVLGIRGGRAWRVTLFMTVVSLARIYLVRRGFEWLG